MRAKAFPFAVASATNDLMFDAMRSWRRGMQRDMTLRNEFTQKAVQVQKAKARRKLIDISGIVGADRGGLNQAGEFKRAYIGLLEDGGTDDAKGKPTNKARKAGYASVLKAGRRMSRLERPNSKHKTGKNRKQRNAIALYYADKERRPTTLEMNADRGYEFGIFTAKKRGKRNRSKKGRYRLDLLWLISPQDKVRRFEKKGTMKRNVGAVAERELLGAMVNALKKEIDQVKRRKGL